MQTLTQRQKAKLVILFSSVLTRDNKGRVKSVLVPGSNGKQYRVIIRRFTNSSHVSKLTVECHQLLNGNNICTCKGNSNQKAHKICYHSQCAIDLALDDAGFTGFWCWSSQDAVKLNQMKKGQIVLVESRQNSKQYAWLVVTKQEK
jgi:hypothetical protein